MLTVAAQSGNGGTRAAVTDGGAGADMLRASSRRYGVKSQSADMPPELYPNGLFCCAGVRTLTAGPHR